MSVSWSERRFNNNIVVGDSSLSPEIHEKTQTLQNILQEH